MALLVVPAGIFIAPMIATRNELAGRVALAGTETEAYTWPLTALVGGIAFGAAASGALAGLDELADRGARRRRLRGARRRARHGAPRDARPGDVSERAALRAMAPFLLAAGAMFAVMYSTQAILPELGREFGVSPARAGLSISAVIAAVALGGWFWGPLSDRIGRRASLVAASALIVVPSRSSRSRRRSARCSRCACCRACACRGCSPSACRT